MRSKKKSLKEEIERINLISKYVVGIPINENRLILESDFMFPIDSDEFNIGYDQKTMGSSQKVLDKDLAVHNSDFGGGDAKHRSRGGHKGVDIFAKKGTPLVACVNGTISKITYDSGLGGNTVTILGNDNKYYYYAHMDKISSDLEKGENVTKGTYLGTVGDSGNAKGTHPHLHFSIYTGNWNAINPFDTLKDSLGIHSVSGIKYNDVELDSSIYDESNPIFMTYNVIINSIEGFGTSLTPISNSIKENIKNCSDLKKLDKLMSSSPIDGEKYLSLFDYINSDINFLDEILSKDEIDELVETLNYVCPNSTKFNEGKFIKK